jgi:ubiquinone/menaquinone biosynthesis C-methylase UbiE
MRSGMMKRGLGILTSLLPGAQSARRFERNMKERAVSDQGPSDFDAVEDNEQVRLEKNLEDCAVPEQWCSYFEMAEGWMQESWEKIIWPMIRGADFSHVLEIGPGAGRNTAMLAQHAKEIHCVDLNEHPLHKCRERFANYPGACVFHFHQNDGHTLPMIRDGSISMIYSWDSMVHCSKEVMHSYIREFGRVLRVDGFGFIHHSNFGEASSKRSFKENPHWRTDMSKPLFLQYCGRSGLRCVEQKVIDWVEARNLDCVSTFTKGSESGFIGA